VLPGSRSSSLPHLTNCFGHSSFRATIRMIDSSCCFGGTLLRVLGGISPSVMSLPFSMTKQPSRIHRNLKVTKMGWPFLCRTQASNVDRAESRRVLHPGHSSTSCSNVQSRTQDRLSHSKSQVVFQVLVW
jgi:hypothetical protein